MSNNEVQKMTPQVLTEAEIPGAEWIAKMIPRFDMETALGHLGAFVAGGDEVGTVSDDDAADALNSVYAHVARMQLEIGQASRTRAVTITEEPAPLAVEQGNQQ